VTVGFGLIRQPGREGANARNVRYWSLYWSPGRGPATSVRGRRESLARLAATVFYARIPTARGARESGETWPAAAT